MSANLGDLVRNNAYRQPEELAVVFGDQRVNFQDQLQRSQKLGGALIGKGLKHQDRIGVLSRNSAHYLEIFAAAQLGGFVIATINFRLAPPEIAVILSDAAPSVLFFEEEYADCVDSIRSALPSIVLFVCIDGHREWAGPYEKFLESGSTGCEFPLARANDVMHLIFTSGTTGRPKGVARTHAAELAVANLMTSEVGVLAGDIVQIMMPLFHVGARWLHLGAQLRGARVILHREFNPLEILETIERERVTITHMTPVIIQSVLDHPRIADFDLSSLKTIYYSAAPMPIALLRRGMERLGSVFLQAYGMTEGFGTTLHKHQHLPNGNAEQIRRLQSVGQASSGVSLRIVGADDLDLPTGSPGEVLTRTATHMAGYWNNSVATVQALRDGWYRTGDVGYLDHHGFLYLVDRKKDMIISGGENIYCREVEVAIATHSAVADVAVIGLPDAKWGESVCAVVVCKPGSSVGEAELQEHCRALLASYKKPKVVEFIDELPRLNTGKVDKVRLRAIYRVPGGRGCGGTTGDAYRPSRCR
jgi:acyl-CoA synthetase (AMP-forming)/AMP-acid ligase II